MSHYHYLSGRCRLVAFIILLLIVSVICLFFTDEISDGYTEEVESTDEEEISTFEEITTEEPTTASTIDIEIPTTQSRWTEEEQYLLAKIAMAEAEGEDTVGKALVICVILNRVENDEFPDTIHDVIFENNGKVYQFSPVIPGGRWYRVEPNEDCYKALEMVQAGWDESNGALYFTSQKGTSWHSENLGFITKHGCHKFYR